MVLIFSWRHFLRSSRKSSSGILSQLSAGGQVFWKTATRHHYIWLVGGRTEVLKEKVHFGSNHLVMATVEPVQIPYKPLVRTKRFKLVPGAPRDEHSQFCLSLAEKLILERWSNRNEMKYFKTEYNTWHYFRVKLELKCRNVFYMTRQGYCFMKSQHVCTMQKRWTIIIKIKETNLTFGDNKHWSMPKSSHSNQLM